MPLCSQVCLHKASISHGVGELTMYKGMHVSMPYLTHRAANATRGPRACLSVHRCAYTKQASVLASLFTGVLTRSKHQCGPLCSQVRLHEASIMHLETVRVGTNKLSNLSSQCLARWECQFVWYLQYFWGLLLKMCFSPRREALFQCRFDSRR